MTTVLILKTLLLIFINTSSKFIAVDQFSNFYVVDNHAALIKLDSSGRETFRYQRLGGTPNAPDATNPFKILLHYPASGIVVFLDNTLTLIGTLDLKAVGYYDAAAVCRASDERVWIYDAATHRLKKLETDGTLYREGSELLQQVNAELNINFIRENNQRVYMCDSINGILVTDAYGNYERTVPIKGLTSFQFVDDRLMYFTKSFMMFYDLKTSELDSTKIEIENAFYQAVYTNDRLLTQGENGLSLYRIIK